MRTNLRLYGPQALRSGLVYGLGLLLGAGLASFLFNVITLESFADLNQVVRLVIGVVLAFAIAGMAGAVGGYTGGYSLPLIDNTKSHWANAWRSAISLSIPLAISLYPILLIISLIAFFNADDPGTVSISTFVLVGVIYGILASVLMGLMAVGRGGLVSLIWAGAVGFGVGGGLLGIGLRLFLFSIDDTGLDSGQTLWVLLGFLGFGLAGGSAWGYEFARLADVARPQTHPRRKWLRVAAFTGFFLLTVVFLRPLFSAVGDLLQPQSANLIRVFDEDGDGVHWSEPVVVSDVSGGQPAIAAAGDRVALTWSGDQTIFSAQGVWDRQDNMTMWGPAVQVSSGTMTADQPQVVIDGEGQSHIIWVKDNFLLTSICTSSTCSAPAALSAADGPTCANGVLEPSNPAVAVGSDGRLLAVWESGGGTLIYSSWSADGAPPAVPEGCVPQPAGTAGNPRLAALSDGRVVLIYQAGEGENDEIGLAEFANGQWGGAQTVGSGHLPSIYTADDDQIHAAWCSEDGLVIYWNQGNQEVVTDLPCLSRPELATDSDNQIHISWFADRVENNAGQYALSPVIYESIRGDSSWGMPAIVTASRHALQPAMAEAGGDLHLAWFGEELNYASQIQYDCDELELSPVGQAVYDVARSPLYRTEGSVVPYCRNEYDRLIIAPNPDPAFSDEPISINGSFDRLAELVEGAHYEVLFSNMWYDQDTTGNSPGRVLADSVAKLYEKLAAHPEQYPRGIRVRILLGHPPESTRGEFAGQIWHVLNDLRNAGVPAMQNEELGWLVEVANFEGTLPHSHIKSLVVDGKTVVAAGFNMSYEHFDVSHPSGLGDGRFDLGIQVTGPVAQDARRMFDDLWEGADRLHCSDFYPGYRPWQTTCLPQEATSDHLPEVMKYYLTPGDTTAFSMYRTEARDEADQQIIAALAAAEKRIDAIQVNFTSELICDLNLLYDRVCTPGQLLPYMEAILDAAENNDTHVRIMIKGAPIDGVESGVHIAVLNEALVERGLDDLVELRIFAGPMHPKSTLIDEEFLIIGSQNFHYSAFGEGRGLAEYSLGVEDRKAVEEYKRLFEYHWERAETID